MLPNGVADLQRGEKYVLSCHHCLPFSLERAQICHHRLRILERGTTYGGVNPSHRQLRPCMPMEEELVEKTHEVAGSLRGARRRQDTFFHPKHAYPRPLGKMPDDTLLPSTRVLWPHARRDDRAGMGAYWGFSNEHGRDGRKCTLSYPR